MTDASAVPTAIGVSVPFPVTPEEVTVSLSDLNALELQHLRIRLTANQWKRPGTDEECRHLLERLTGIDTLICADLAMGELDETPPETLLKVADVVTSTQAILELNLTGVDRDSARWPALAQVLGRWLHALEECGALPVVTLPEELLPALADLLHRNALAVGLDLGEGREPADAVARAQQVLNDSLPVWITDIAASTLRHREREQLERLVAGVDSGAERIYWSALQDRNTDPGETHDEAADHLGLRRRNGTPKLLFRLLAEGGVPAVRGLLRLARPGPDSVRGGSALITGGAGFIGCNLADRLLHSGEEVTILDNLSRPGTESNIRWLAERHGHRLRFRLGDLRDRPALRRALTGVDSVFHFAAQVAVTTSLEDPHADHATNGRGTLNLLEELRRLDTPPSLVFTSTNKVYGALKNIALRAGKTRYLPEDSALAAHGVDEEHPLDFCSPYGCSKGAADQYVLDYARTFGLTTTVLRMSCIYGPRQFGTEDQGWIAHFLIRALRREPLTLFGDGFQVRDVLFIDDLVTAMRTAREQAAALAGQPFNIGGGPTNTLSLRELLERLRGNYGLPLKVTYRPWRLADQRYYVSDISRFSAATGWQPQVPVGEGIDRLHAWLRALHAGEAASHTRVAL